jgi:hypothetical protein
MRPLTKPSSPNSPARNFREWLARARLTRDPEGDLVGDMRTDSRLPKFRDLDQMLTYLKTRDACYGALRAAPRVWRRYKRRRAL